jgi:uncharacterized protein (TIGR02145 family)
MKTYLVLIVALLALLVSCKKDTLPTVETLAVNIKDATHVTLNGNVKAEGSSAVNSRGFCWALNTSPTVNDHYSQNEFGPGAFTEDIEIMSDTTYYVRTYAINSFGTTYGNEVNFATIDSFPNSFVDSRDGHKYRWVKIGNQLWMAENLAYLPTVSPSAVNSRTSPIYYVYGYEGNNVSEAKATTNFKTYGVLYNWPAELTACPLGWHLPSDEEWKTLEIYLGMSNSEIDTNVVRYSGTVGGKLKETGTVHWESPNTGATNSIGFGALPGGNRLSPGGPFVAMGRSAFFWSSTASAAGTNYPWDRLFSFDNDGSRRFADINSSGFSARCIKD